MKPRTKPMHMLLRISLVIFIAFGFFSIPHQIVRAVTHAVTNSLNNGTGSLRQAILDSSSGDIITFDSSLSGVTITLSSTLTIGKNLTIDGSSLASPITISGNNAVRVLTVSSGTSVILSSLIISKGNDTSYYGGGGIYNQGNLTITDCIISGNSSEWDGAGIYNTGTLTTSDCTITGNHSGWDGAGILIPEH